MILHMFAGACLLAAASAGGVPVARQSQDVRPAPPAAQARPAATVSTEGLAYFQFLLGRHLESENDVEGAIKAYTEAARLDPKSAEILAELASLYARDGKLDDALKYADLALRNNADNVTAHRVMGILYASLARADEGSGPLSADEAGYAAKAADHLDAARRQSPLTDVGIDMMLAQIYYRTGAYDKAIPVLMHLATEEPGRPEPVNLLVQSYERAGRSDEAIKLLEATVAEQPQLYAPLGELYERRQRWVEAAGAYERAVERNPKNPELRTRLALALLSGGGEAQAGRAVEILLQVRQENPADSRVLYLLAQAQRSVGKIDDAEKTARELIDVAPGALTGPYALALALESKQQYRQVVEVLVPATSRAPSPAAGIDVTPLLVHLGFAHVELGEFDKALDAFERARAASPQNPAIDLYTLQAQVSARRFDDAVALARKIRAARPGDQRALRLEADALRLSGRVSEGAALLSGALDANSADVTAYLALSEYHAQAQQFDLAIQVLERAAAKFPTDVTVNFQEGAVLERQKKFAEAERKFKDVLAKDPLHAQALNYLGYMLADRGERLDESIGYIKRALEVDPYNGAYFDSLGWAYFRQNKLDLAETNLRRAAEQRVRDSAVQDHFGDLLFRLGRFDDAISAWQRALAGDGQQVDRAGIDKKIRAAREKAQKR
jgi:tetratricopeptide (TPR) repeat protein